MIAGVHGVASGRATRCAASDATFSLTEVDIGLAADLRILLWVPKLVANELAFSARALTEKRRCAVLGLVSCVVSGLGAEVVGTAIVESLEVMRGRASSLSWGLKDSSPMRPIIRALLF